MKEISAQEARELSGVKPVDDLLEIAFSLIRQAASAGKRSLQIHHILWEQAGYKNTSEYKLACDKLRELGFEIKFHYEEKQLVDMYTCTYPRTFVDMYTLVEW